MVGRVPDDVHGFFVLLLSSSPASKMESSSLIRIHDCCCRILQIQALVSFWREWIVLFALSANMLQVGGGKTMCFVVFFRGFLRCLTKRITVGKKMLNMLLGAILRDQLCNL